MKNISAGDRKFQRRSAAASHRHDAEGVRIFPAGFHERTLFWLPYLGSSDMISILPLTCYWLTD